MFASKHAIWKVPLSYLLFAGAGEQFPYVKEGPLHVARFKVSAKICRLCKE